MSSGDADAQTWIDRGRQAYWNMNLAEAYLDFENAVAADPKSPQARLCYGVVCLFLYQNGISDAIPQFLRDHRSRTGPDERQAEVQRIRALIAEQNATNGKRAEENLQRALELDPRNAQAMEYLALLYSVWSDPDIDALGNKRRSRLAGAQRWYQHVLDIYPDHKFANYVSGVINWNQAFEFIRSSGSYPLPVPNEDARRALYAQVAPLLDTAARNLSRSLQIDPGKWQPMSYLAAVKRAQAYVAATLNESAHAASEAEAWNRKAHQILESQAKAAGQPWPAGPSATVAFRPAPRNSPAGSTSLPPFPPDAQMLIPPGMPLPPPAIQR